MFSQSTSYMVNRVLNRTLDVAPVNPFVLNTPFLYLTVFLFSESRERVHWERIGKRKNTKRLEASLEPEIECLVCLCIWYLGNIFHMC